MRHTLAKGLLFVGLSATAAWTGWCLFRLTLGLTGIALWAYYFFLN